jgi:hypothetical protein
MLGELLDSSPALLDHPQKAALGLSVACGSSLALFRPGAPSEEDAQIAAHTSELASGIS